jgi:alkylation response protein AidB-like acyl-CoA dehydrogenase
MNSITSTSLSDAQEKQEAIQGAARDVLRREWSPRAVRDLIDTPPGFSPDLWQTIRGLGWPAVALPERFGGEGGTLVELFGLAEELGRAIAPTPLLPTLIAAEAVLRSDNGALRERVLPAIARGDTTLALALLEPGLTADLTRVTLAATRTDSGYRLDGTKLFVPFGQHADALVTVARLEHGGIALFLAGGEAAGLRRRALKPLDWSPLAEVVYDGVTVGPDDLIASGDRALEILEAVISRGRLITAIELLGVAEGALEMAVEYAKERVAFGRPIGSFQAVKHKLVDLRANVEVARALSQGAAQRLALGAPDARLAAARAVFWALDTLRKVPEGSLQVFGGIGFTWDHDIHLYVRRAATLASLLGERATHRDIIVSHLDAVRESA